MEDQNITLTLSQTECQSLAGLLDLACKAGGIRVAKDVSNLADKLDAAMQAAAQPKDQAND